MSFKKLALAFCCLAVVTVGATQAAKLKIKNLPLDVFPSVDDVGDLDFGDTWTGLVKATVNLKNGKATISGKATVDNFSGARATFNDEDLAGGFIGGTLVSDKYTVTKKGKATYNGRYNDVVL